MAQDNGLRAGRPMDLSRARRRTRPSRAGCPCPPPSTLSPVPRLGRRDGGLHCSHAPRSFPRSGAGGRGRDSRVGSETENENVARGRRRDLPRSGDRRCHDRIAVLRRRPFEWSLRLRDAEAAAALRTRPYAQRAGPVSGAAADGGRVVLAAPASIDCAQAGGPAPSVRRRRRPSDTSSGDPWPRATAAARTSAA